MSTVAEIEASIEKLPHADYRVLLAWVEERQSLLGASEALFARYAKRSTLAPKTTGDKTSIYSVCLNPGCDDGWRPMEKQKEESPDISHFERLIDESWNERKHLAELEFKLRSEIQSLLQQGAASEAFQAARERERACRASLAKNNDEYDSVMESWAAEVFKAVP